MPVTNCCGRFLSSRINPSGGRGHCSRRSNLASALGAAMPFWYALLISFESEQLVASRLEHVMVARPWLDLRFAHDRLHRAPARAHQQSDCSLATGFLADPIGGVAPAVGHASRHTGCFLVVALVLLVASSVVQSSRMTRQAATLPRPLCMLRAQIIKLLQHASFVTLPSDRKIL